MIIDGHFVFLLDASFNRTRWVALDSQAWEGSGQPLQWFWLMHPEAQNWQRQGETTGQI